MKKLVFLSLMLVSTWTLAQENRTQKAVPNIPLKYSTDIVIESTPLIDQDNVRLSVAFNGWLYAAFSTVDIAMNKGGITILRSKDNGQTWQSMDSYSVSGIRYPTFDIVVAGTDTNNLRLYLAGVNHDLSSPNYTLFVDRYDARTGSFVGSNLNINKGSRTIYDVSIATDYQAPAVGSIPYSIGLAYTMYGSNYDTLNTAVSLDGGGSFSVFNTVMSTSWYLRKVSLAYGRSASASNGRYFVAWEVLGSTSSRNGHIYTSRNNSTIDGSWIPPKNLDSVSSTMINLCRNPSIAVQYNNIDNDSSGPTALVLVERDFTGDGSDYDLLGFYNMRAHYTNNWFRLDIVNTGEKDLNPDITYDPGYNNFLAVYYDSTNGKLPYCVNGMNLATPSSWSYVSLQYNDNTSLTAAKPRVEINPLVNMTAHVWIQDGGTNGVAMFDAEYVYTGIEENQNEGVFSDGQLYPNPATDIATLQFTMAGDADISIQVFDATGKLIESRTATNRKAGDWMETFDVGDWNNGIYLISVRSNQESITKRLIVSH